MKRQDKTPEQALQSLMALCAKAERSGGDARRLMARWGVDPAARDAILEKLIRGRFIDDARYAAAYVREKSSLSGWGVHKIRAGLAAKGVAREVTEQALTQIAPEKAADKLEELLTRKARTTRGATPWEVRSKLVRYGLSRGFDYPAVAEAVERLIKAEDPE